jgi:hypothetical protein
MHFFLWFRQIILQAPRDPPIVLLGVGVRPQKGLVHFELAKGDRI